MAARDLIDNLRNGGAEIYIADGDYIEVTGNLTDAQREAIRAYKPELLKILEDEEWRRRHELIPTWHECENDAGDLWDTFTKEGQEGYRRSLTTSNLVRAGIVPSSYKYVVTCRKCGPVYTDIAIDTGCPWCRRNVPKAMVPKPSEES